jgi:hypothetical protein
MRDTEPGLLFVTLRGQAPVFISAHGEANYTQDVEGRAIITRNGSITIYDGGVISLEKVDPQLTTKGLAYYNNPLLIGFTRTAGGAESMRFYYDGSISDFSLARYLLTEFQGFIDVGFFSMAGTLMFCYLTEKDSISSMGITVWDI